MVPIKSAIGAQSDVITYVYSSLFDSPAQTLVNTVNTVGVMGKGVAKVFKASYPKMFSEYKRLCEGQQLEVGRLHLWKGANQWVLNFPTKTTWRQPSKLEYIEAGLDNFVSNYAQMGIASVSFPPLGCGNGGLPWLEVRTLMENYLKSINIPVYIHNVQVPDGFLPEHIEQQKAPSDFSEFWRDIVLTIEIRKGRFTTTEGQRDFTIQVSTNRSLYITHSSGKGESLDFEEMENAWVAMRDGILSIDRYPDEKSRRYKSYIFPVLASLPYVKMVPIARGGQNERQKSSGLFLMQSRGSSSVPGNPVQGCLSL